MSFSQNNEEQIIKSYFGESIGSFLEVGANNGKTLSNCYQLALDGWAGVCVEPSSKVWMQLNKNHLKHNKVQLLNVGIADYNSKAKFFDSGLLSFRKNQQEVWFNTPNNKKRMLVIPFGEDALFVVANYLQSDEGIQALKILEKLLD